MNDHNGGIYTGETVADICAEIFAGSGLSYSVGADVGAVQCYGRLPRANRRTNLGKLLVATGATLSESNGTVLITYLGAGAPTTMYQRNIYMQGGSVVNKDRSTGVEVTEHAFYQLNTDADAVLFDNTTEVTPVTSQLVVFQEPCHDLTATGTLTIEESNANFAVVSGVGTLSGKVYTHTQRQISKSTGVTSNKVKVEKLEFMLSADDTAIYAAYNAGDVDRAGPGRSPSRSRTKPARPGTSPSTGNQVHGAVTWTPGTFSKPARAGPFRLA